MPTRGTPVPGEATRVSGGHNRFGIAGEGHTPRRESANQVVIPLDSQLLFSCDQVGLKFLARVL